MTKITSVAKDFHRLMKRIGKLTDGQASIQDVEWDDVNLGKFHVVIKPNSGYYKGCIIKFQIRNLESYQDGQPPTVFCLTKIYHPNIDPTDEDFDDNSNVCLNILDEGTWLPALGLDGVVLGLIFLLNNPNKDDALSPYFDSCNDEDFEENIRKYVAGEEIDGVKFDNGMSELKVKQENEPVCENEVIGEINTEATDDIKVHVTKEDIKINVKTSEEYSDVSEHLENQKNVDVNEDSDQKGEDNGNDNDEDDDVTMLELISFDGELVLATNTFHDEETKLNESAGDDCADHRVLNSNDSAKMAIDNESVKYQETIEEQLEPLEENAQEVNLLDGATEAVLTASDTNARSLGTSKSENNEDTFERLKNILDDSPKMKVTILTTFGLLFTYVCGRCIVKRLN